MPQLCQYKYKHFDVGMSFSWFELKVGCRLTLRKHSIMKLVVIYYNVASVESSTTYKTLPFRDRNEKHNPTS